MLTVFIATRNGAATLPRVLAAYGRLRVPTDGWKLVVADNGSTDGSAEIARAFTGRLPLVCVAEQRRGKNRALNVALGELEGELAVFSDDDCLPDADWLTELDALSLRHPECAIFGGRTDPIWTTAPPDWILRWVRLAPVFALTDAATCAHSRPRRPRSAWCTRTCTASSPTAPRVTAGRRPFSTAC